MKKYIFVFIPILLILISIPIAIIAYNQYKGNQIAQNSLTEQQKTDDKSKDLEGTIYIEAGTGTLTGDVRYSYIKESARGLEAYLGDKGVSAVYEFESAKEGDYTLWVKLSDDAKHAPNARDVTIVVNNSRTLGYKNYPEDTKGWKWYEIGQTPIKSGKNTITFTKDADTTAAYVMDEFKFVPVK